MSERPRDDRSWWLVLPVVLAVSFSAIVPLMTVVNYSVQDILSPDQRVFVGWEWFRKALRDPELHAAFGRQLGFSAAVLLIELPFGLGLALLMPRRGALAGFSMAALALPLLVPWNVVGTVWQVFSRPDIGLGGRAARALGLDYDPTLDPVDAWATVLAMDVWHWTPLVTLLAYAGLKAVPEPFYRAAAIDGASRWQVFRHVELPRLKSVLTIALLLRFMDSFMIYTEPFVLTGGGPGNATTFLSQTLTRLAVGQFDLGPAAAFSLIYFLIVLATSHVFYTALTRREREEGR